MESPRQSENGIPFAVYVAAYPVKTSAAGNTGQQVKSLHGSSQGILPLCCSHFACCFYFCFVCCTATTMIAICKKRNAFEVHSHTHTHTHSWGSNSWVSEREREKETECRFVYPVRDNTFKRADIARFALPSGKWTKVCSSCGQLRAAAAFAASAKYIENLTACLFACLPPTLELARGTQNCILHLSVCLRASHKIRDPLDYYVVHVALWQRGNGAVWHCGAWSAVVVAFSFVKKPRVQKKGVKFITKVLTGWTRSSH